MMKKVFTVYLILIGSAALLGCARQHYVFSDAPPVESYATEPTGVPEESSFNTREYILSSAVRHPLIQYFNTTRPSRSQDVNALDQIPASSWFTPRLGFREISNEEIVRGPEKIGPPEKPLTIVKTKKEGTDPGFIVEDARGHRYLIKFDSPDYPGYKSTINFVVNRLFWAFGYNVPEDYVVSFDRKDVKIGESRNLDLAVIEDVFSQSKTFQTDHYRATASLYLKGKVLGHIPQKGVRKGDPNDRIPHENLRILRALYVFCALTNQTGIRSDNTLDVYVGEEGRGHTVHYLLDFGEALGAHGLEYHRRWEGGMHRFAWEELFENAIGLGVKLKEWEKIEGRIEDPQIYFESQHFEPGRWKEVYQFQPIQHAGPDDHYWAVKVIAGLKESHLRALFKAADYRNQQATAYLIRTLMKRRQKLLEHFLGEVSPLEGTGLRDSALQLVDLGKEWLGDERQYQARFYDSGRHQISEPLLLSIGRDLSVTFPKDFLEGYLRVEIAALEKGEPISRPVEFHIRKNAGHPPKLAGVVH